MRTWGEYTRNGEISEMCARLQEESYKDVRPWIEVPQGASRLAAQANNCEMSTCVGIRHYIISDSGRLRFANNVGRGGWKDVGRIMYE